MPTWDYVEETDEEKQDSHFVWYTWFRLTLELNEDPPAVVELFEGHLVQLLEMAHEQTTGRLHF